MRGEHQACAVRHGPRRRGDRVAEHLHEQRMVVVLAQFHQLRRALAGGPAGPGDVFDVLRATGIPAPCRRREHRGASNSVVPHGGDGVLDVRLPVAVAEVHRQIERGLQLFDQRAVDAVDRRDAAEVQVVLGDVGEPLARDAPAPSDVLQERHHLFGRLRPAERQQQDRVELH